MGKAGKTMNNQVRITYNPYEKTIGYEYRSNPDQPWVELDEHNTLANKYQRGSLQNYSEDIVQAIIKDFCSDGKGVDLFFRGTVPDWEDLKDIVRRIDSKEQLCCCDGESTLISAGDALSQINKIFKELSSYLNMSENSEIKCVLDQYLEAVRPEIVLVVVGTYSAGKSTFVNALIGEELLPTASIPTTAKIFKISSLPQGDWHNTEIRFKYGTQNTKICFTQKGYHFENPTNLPDLELKYCLDAELKDVAPSAAYVYHTISVLNTFNEKKRETAKNLISELIEVDVPFHCSTLPLENYQFTVYDLPGPNAHNNKEHREVLKKALAEQTNGVPVFVVDPDNMSSDSVGELRNQLSGIEALDESSIMVIINKADTKSPNTLLENIHSSTGAVAIENAENRVFCVSSIAALGGKKDDMNQCVSQDVPFIYRRMKADFLSGEIMLFKTDNALPQHLYHSVCAEGEKANATGDNQQKLLHNSGLWAVEHEIGRFAEKYAAYNKVQQAQKYLSLAIEKVKEQTELKQTEQANVLDQITRSMDEKKQSLIHTLKEKCEQMQQNHSLEYVEKINTVIEAPSLSGSAQKWKASLREQWKTSKKNETQTQTWINSKLSALQESAAATLYSESHKFWNTRINSFKKKCVEIVTESTAFSESENEFLKQYILACPQPEFAKISFDFKEKAKKSWRFLFWHGEEFDLKTCADNMEKGWENAIARMSHSYLQNVQSTTQNWYKDFIAGLTERCADFNPALKDLVKERKACEHELSNLLLIENKLVQKKQEIICLFQFDSEES